MYGCTEIMLGGLGVQELLPSTPKAPRSFPSTDLTGHGRAPFQSQGFWLEAEGSGEFEVLCHTESSGPARIHETLSQTSYLQRIEILLRSAVAAGAAWDAAGMSGLGKMEARVGSVLSRLCALVPAGKCPG